MSIFVPGMKCSISGQVIQTADQAVIFPAFIANEKDPLHVFNDAVIHIDVFREHPLSQRVQARYKEAQERVAPENRRCRICREAIQNPESYLGLGYLVDEADRQLSDYNYAHFHRGCLARWSELPALIRQLEKLDKSGTWKGEGLKRLIGALYASRVAAK